MQNSKNIFQTLRGLDLASQDPEEVVEYISANYNAVEAYVLIKQTVDVLEIIRKQLVGIAYQQFDKEYKIGQVKVQKSVSVNYDYKQTNCPQLAKLQQMLAERQQQLKELPYSYDEVDTETGEVITVSPATRRETETIKISTLQP